MIRKPVELLAPAGSPDAYKAAAAAGADAVYLGAKAFNARAQAQNFEDADLTNVIEDAHIRGMKVYLVLNTLLGNNEMEEAAAVASFVYREGIDGIIVQDLGLVHVLKKMAPELDIHASTQMTLHNIDGVRAAEALGIKRVVLARELSLKEIESIVQSTGIQVEVFVHGALCISRSGQCLLSSFIGGRSGNRGRCAQPCRLPWKADGATGAGEYLLSPKDLMTLEILPELLQTGISSLKIEGRMKSPEYVAAVVMIYRKYLDMALENPSSYKVDQGDIRTLAQVFNRGGFTKGYFQGIDFKNLMSTEHPKHRGVPAGIVVPQETFYQPRFGGKEDDRLIRIQLKDEIRMGDGLEIWDSRHDNPSAIISVMMSQGKHVKTARKGDTLLVGNFKSDALPKSMVYKTYDKQLMEQLSGFLKKSFQRVPVTGQIHLAVGEKAVFRIADRDGNEVMAESDEITQQAKEKPITEERISDQLKKTGDTPYFFEAIEISIDDKSFVPVSVLNDIRRKALDLLTEKRRIASKRQNATENQTLHRHFPGNEMKLSKQREICVYFYEIPQNLQWEGLNAEMAVLPVHSLEFLGEVRKHLKAFVWIPAVLHDRQMEWVIQKISAVKDQLDGLMVGNLGILHRVREAFPDLPVALDFQMNIFNSWSLSAMKKYTPVSAALSVELTLASIQELSSPGIPLEAYVYGDIPVMTLEYCPGSNRWNCNRKCGSCEYRQGVLTDRLGKQFRYHTDPILQRTILYNSSRIMLEDVEPLKKSDVSILRLAITDESAQEVHTLCDFYNAQWANDAAFSSEELLKEFRKRSYTKGHFYRGVE